MDSARWLVLLCQPGIIWGKTMELFTYFRSSAAYRVRIAFNLKGLVVGKDYEMTSVNLVGKEQQSDTYLRVNPQGLIPALRLDSGEVIAQSGAILDWLENQYPEPPLVPADAVNRAKVIAATLAVGADIHPLNNLRVLNYLKSELGVTEDQKNQWYHHWIHTGFKALELQVKKPYCFGEAVTLADVYLIPQIVNAMRFELDMAAYPKLQSIFDACSQLNPFMDAHPDQQADRPRS